jgi:hypothetical protein
MNGVEEESKTDLTNAAHFLYELMLKLEISPNISGNKHHGA